MMPRQIHTLSDVARATAPLEIACSRCDRRGRYWVGRLVARFGGSSGIPHMLTALSADCPRRKSVSPYEACDPYIPGLGDLIRSLHGVPDDGKLR